MYGTNSMGNTANPILTIRMRLSDAYCADATRTDHMPDVRAWCETIQDTAWNLIYTIALFSILLANSISPPPNRSC